MENLRSLNSNEFHKQISLNKQRIQNNIKCLCTTKCITLTKLAEKSNIAPHTLSRFLNNHGLLSLRTLKSIANALDITAEQLVFYDFNIEIFIDYEKLAVNIKCFCILRGMSLTELANKATINYRTLYSILNNEQKPRGSSLLLIAFTLGVTLEELTSSDFSKGLSIYYQKFSLNVRYLCRANSITMLELSKRADICYRTLCKILNNNHIASPKILRLIADALGYTIEELSTQTFYIN